MNDLKEKFLNYRNALYKACEKGYVHFVISLKINSFRANSDIFGLSTSFWAYSLYAHSECAFSYLARILEIKRKSSDPISIHKFLNLILSSNEYIFDAPVLKEVKSEVKKDLALLEKKKPFIEKIMDLRDNFLSHFDKDTFRNMKSFFEKNEIKDDEIEGIFYLIENIINKYLHLFNQSIPSHDFKNWKVTIDLDFHNFEG